MSIGSLVKHKYLLYTGIVVSISNNIAEVLLTYPDVYSPLFYSVDNLEVVNIEN